MRELTLTERPAIPLAHRIFGQLASPIGAPAAYLRQLPVPLAGINLQYGLTSHRAGQIKTLEIENSRVELRAVTGPDYGRIYDHELVSAVQRIASDGVGDTRWKVPGVLDWSTRIYNPNVDVTEATTIVGWNLQEEFATLRRLLEARMGKQGKREFGHPARRTLAFVRLQTCDKHQSHEALPEQNGRSSL